ncbi:BON domain-containing protein [Rhizobium terricola]|nr:BON domain-containing protein [Rhizobium terricola]
MMTNGARDRDEFSREEDYRDFEQRDIDGGWPYDDGAGAGAKPVANAAYGETDANFDRERNRGFRVTKAEPDGSEAPLVSPVLPETDHRELSDQLEADIHAALENFSETTLSAVDLHVDGHVVTLRGDVDTPGERRLIELKVLGVAGVTTVRNLINTIGTDAHIPTDTE